MAQQAAGGTDEVLHVGGNTLLSTDTDPRKPATVRPEPTVAQGHCPKCDRLFRRPRMLPCGHNFCDPCIRAHVAGYPKHQKETGVFHCMSCEDMWEIPEDGVDGLPVSQDIESVEYSRNNDEYCSKHTMQKCYHCRECNITVCSTCYNEDHRDRGHGLSRHRDTVVRKKASIQAALRDVTPKVDKINQYRKRIEMTKDQIAKDAANELKEIDETVTYLVEHLQEKGESLKKAVSEIADIERKKLTKSVEGLKNIVTDFDDIKAKAKQLAQQGNDADIDAEADDLLAQLNKDWNPSVPFDLVVTSWKSKRVDLCKLEYDSPQLGTTTNHEQKIRFQFDILSYSGASVNATEVSSFTSGFDDWNRTQFCTSHGGFIFMSGKKGNFWKICKFDLYGKQLWETEQMNIDDKTVPKPCGLQVLNLGTKQFLASSSASQHNILFYDINIPRPEACIAYADQKLHFNQMCILPPSTLLTVCAEQNKERKVLYLRESNDAGPHMMARTHIMETHMEDAYGIYVVSTSLTQEGNLIILTSWKKEGTIKAFKLDGKLAWATNGILGGLPCNPHGVCADRRSHVYIADGRNKRVIVLNAENGKYIQTLLTNDQHGIGLVYSVGWSEMRDQRFLIVNHKSERQQQIHTFKIGYQVKFGNQETHD